MKRTIGVLVIIVLIKTIYARVKMLINALLSIICGLAFVSGLS